MSWSGMEHSDFAPGGLGRRNWQEVLDELAALGYNAIRIPFSSEAIQSHRPIGGVNFALNPDLEGLTGLEMLDRLVEGARERGLKVILDRHHPTSGARTELWYTAEVTEQRWIDDWRMLAGRYLGNDTVIAVDLHNEPHGPATWGSGDPGTDWHLAAERAGNAVLEVNPYLLIFIEGIQHFGADSYWWGGNLIGVRAAPVRLQVPNRVVYTPHDYGPSVSPQPWFSDPHFPQNLPDVWDHYWGYIHREELAPVIVGEFGGRSFGDDIEGQWHRALLDYIQTHHLGFVLWSVNPSWDTGGVFLGDWETIDQTKQAAYAPHLAAPLDVGLAGVFGISPANIKVLVRRHAAGLTGGEARLTLRIVNDGPVELDPGRLELRYWLPAGTTVPPEGLHLVDVGSSSLAVVDIVQPTDAAPYIRLRFPSEAGFIPAYRASGDLTIRLPGAVLPAVAQATGGAAAAPAAARERFEEWDQAALYLDGRLAWGREPPG